MTLNYASLHKYDSRPLDPWPVRNRNITLVLQMDMDESSYIPCFRGYPGLSKRSSVQPIKTQDPLHQEHQCCSTTMSKCSALCFEIFHCTVHEQLHLPCHSDPSCRRCQKRNHTVSYRLLRHQETQNHRRVVSTEFNGRTSARQMHPPVLNLLFISSKC
jgi:hypothetical protein